ncbi:MAG: tetratricopeptide repeat protein [Candidatus Omnitrophica bacterium]|nr:tetratricopeptide repeat protein [Candidatus Omnitrophota bacterium]
MRKRYAVVIIVLIGIAVFYYYRGLAHHLKDDDAARFDLARNLAAGGQYPEALPVLRTLHKIYPADQPIARLLTIALAQCGRGEDTLRVLHQYEGSYGRDDRLLDEAIAGLESARQPAAARRLLEKKLRRNPADAAVLRKIAALSVVLDDRPGIVSAYERLLAAAPVDTDLVREYADILFSKQQYEEALQYYRRAAVTPDTDALRAEKMAFAYMRTGGYAAAVELYAELLRRSPQQYGLRAELINAYYAAGDRAAAEREAVFSETAAVDTGVLLSVAETVAAHGHDQRAAFFYDVILSRNPGHAAALAGKARVFSRQGNYRDAARLYERLMAVQPQEISPRREYARALGKAGLFRQSLAVYRGLARDTKDAALAREMEAKDALYHRDYRRARAEYRLWLEQEPENSEALMDCVGIETAQQQVAAARGYYERLAAVLPDDPRVVHGRRRLAADIGMCAVSAEHLWQETDSLSRRLDRRLVRQGISLDLPLQEHLRAVTRVEQCAFSFKDFPDVRRQQFAGGFNLFAAPWAQAAAEYAWSNYSRAVDTTASYAVTAQMHPWDGCTLRLRQAREDVLDNSQTLRNSLRQKVYAVRAEAAFLIPDFTLGGDYRFSGYTDDNDAQTRGLDAGYRVRCDVNRFSFLYRYETISFAAARADYFSPPDFTAQMIGGEWRRSFQRAALPEDEPLFYAAFGYTYRWETGAERGHTVSARLHKEFSETLRLDAGIAKTMYERQATYADDRCNGSLTVRF